jgi:hypothetical protein
MEEKPAPFMPRPSFSVEGKHSDLSGFSCEDACRLLEEQGTEHPCAKDDAVSYIGHFTGWRPGQWRLEDDLSWPEKAYVHSRFQDRPTRLGVPMISLPAGIGTGWSEDVISIASEYGYLLKASFQTRLAQPYPGC